MHVIETIHKMQYQIIVIFHVCVLIPTDKTIISISSIIMQTFKGSKKWAKDADLFTLWPEETLIKTIAYLYTITNDDNDYLQ